MDSSSKDSTDEEIIEVLLPVQDLRREVADLRAENERLRALLQHSEKRWRRMARALARAVIAVEWDGERCIRLAGLPNMNEVRSALRVCFKEAQHEGIDLRTTRPIGGWKDNRPIEV